MAVVARLDRYRAALVAAMSQPVASTEYVFTAGQGRGAASEQSIAKTELRGTSPTSRCRCKLNDLRHMFASSLANNSRNLLIIGDAPGHTTRTSER